MPKDAFENQTNDFEEVVDFSFRVSLKLNGLPATEQSALASIVHTKMCITSASVVHMFTAPLFDHSAIVALCRMLMEAMTFYFYLAEDVEPDEWKTRHLCLKIHDTVNRIKLMRGFQSVDQYADLLMGRDELVGELEKEAFFISLQKDRQTRLLSGDHFYLKGMNAAAKKAGWNFRKFLAFYSHFSAHAHSSPMSFFRTKQHKIDYSDPSEAQLSLTTVALCVAEYCLLKVTLAHLDTSPDSKAQLDKQEVLKFEKSLEEWKTSYEVAGAEI
jgi:hypothetical protein